MAPKVYLVSSPRFEVDAFLNFLAEEGTSWKRAPGVSEAEEIVEAAGRICYMSFGDKQSPKTNAEYVRHLVAMEHESVLEHVDWGFVLTGVSRAFSHQLVRHRPGFAFSQLSQQYHEETGAQFVEPQLKLPSQAQAAWDRAIHTAKEAYREILESLTALEGQADNDNLRKRELRRAIRSTARSVLPNATETKIFVTANARALRHFFRVRGSIPGDFEMRQVGAAMLRCVKEAAPSLFADFEIETAKDGYPIVVKKLQP
jgi:thymidylate synthase (FAD)